MSNVFCAKYRGKTKSNQIVHYENNITDDKEIFVCRKTINYLRIPRKCNRCIYHFFILYVAAFV